MTNPIHEAWEAAGSPHPFATFRDGYERGAEAMKAENAALRARLEIEDDAPAYDGIACRDATISGQDRLIDDLRAENARLRNSAWVNGDVLQESQAEIAKLRAELAHLRTALSRTLMALEGYLPRHRNDVTDRAIAVARAALAQEQP